MSHANARLTIHGRLLIAERARSGWKQAHIAAAMGVSRRCAKRWLDRHRDEGEPGLRDRSSRPHRIANCTSAAKTSEVIAVRTRERVGRDEVAVRTGVPPRTVSRIIARAGLPRLAELDPMTGERIRASKTTSIRYERERPGDLVHMDVKKLGRIPDGGGWRSRGETATNHQTRLKNAATRAGYDFVHSVVDDHSRLAYSEVLPDEKGATCAAFFERAISYFTAHGITRIERLITDNASAYRYSLHEVCAAHGIRQTFIKPHCPWQNGKVERFNRTLQTEWAYRQPFHSNADRTAALDPWLQHYNTGRRHSALGGQPPISRLQPTS